MITASRLCRPAYTAFNGEGGLYRAGRWHELGNRVVYAAESEALAALKVMVHLSSAPQFPEYICVKAHIPEEIVVDIHTFGTLPPDWSSDEPLLSRALSMRWMMTKASAVLRVPSVVIPRESNYVINPEHANFSTIELDLPLLFQFDVRLAVKSKRPF